MVNVEPQGRHPTRPGLCQSCKHVRVVCSDRGSLFYRCQRSLVDLLFPAYPRLPVLTCDGFERCATRTAPSGPEAGESAECQ
jgi:hypothetical protein